LPDGAMSFRRLPIAVKEWQRIWLAKLKDPLSHMAAVMMSACIDL